MKNVLNIKTTATVPCQLQIKKLNEHFLIVFSVKNESEYITFKVYAPTFDELENELEIFKECYDLDIDIAKILRDFLV